VQIQMEMEFQPKPKQWLLLSDSGFVKDELRCFPDLKRLQNRITHFGEGVRSTSEEIRNNLLEFYLMSQASHIFAFSVYEHGSGFSQWCAATYEIPYVCRYIVL